MPIQEQAPDINLFDGPIAGQSMTADPNSKQAWDGPPEFSSVREASEAIFLDLLETENLKPIVSMLQDDVPVSDITQVLLLTGFQKGKFNPDLLMLLIEPVMYMIMAIADKFGIADVKIYQGEEEDELATDDDMSGEEYEKVTTDTLQKIFKNKRISPDLRNTIENSQVAQKLANIDVDNIDVKSLMAREEVPETEAADEVTETTESLLNREE